MPSFMTLLVAYGLCFGLQNDKAKFITNPLRKFAFLDAMLSCTYCTGFHCGWMAWLVVACAKGISPAGWHDVASLVMSSFAAAGFCYFVEAAVRWLEANTSGEG